MSELAPPNMMATAQGLKQTIANIGTLVGSVMGGWLLTLDNYDGATIMYRGGAVMMFVSMILYLLARRCHTQ
jgi:predicted MFS family arabinose efflux permease